MRSTETMVYLRSTKLQKAVGFMKLAINVWRIYRVITYQFTFLLGHYYQFR